MALQKLIIGEHPVWGVLPKERYTEDGIKCMVTLYNFMERAVSELGECDARVLFNYWNEYSSETFRILEHLSGADGSKAQENDNNQEGFFNKFSKNLIEQAPGNEKEDILNLSRSVRLEMIRNHENLDIY